MSTPRSGIVEIFASAPDGSGLVQGSGVLVAPDEVLTAAHVIDDATGVLSRIAVVTGAGGAAVPAASKFSSATAHVDPGYAPSASDLATSAEAVHDFALIHLAQPVAGTVYALGTALNGGTLTAGGYPAGTNEGYDEATEAFAVDPYQPGLFDAKPLGEGGDPRGSSGGPVLQGSAHTVVGLVQGVDLATGMGDFVQLTSADVAEVQGWIAADHPSAAPAPAAPAAPAAASPLDALAAAIAGDAASAPNAIRQTAMHDVAAALSTAAAAGASDIEDAAGPAAAGIRAGSLAPRRALAYLGGLLSALGGAARADVPGDVAEMFPILTARQGQAALGSLAGAGWDEMTALMGSPAVSGALAAPWPDAASPAAQAPAASGRPHAA